MPEGVPVFVRAPGMPFEGRQGGHNESAFRGSSADAQVLEYNPLATDLNVQAFPVQSISHFRRRLNFFYTHGAMDW